MDAIGMPTAPAHAQTTPCMMVHASGHARRLLPTTPSRPLLAKNVSANTATPKPPPAMPTPEPANLPLSHVPKATVRPDANDQPSPRVRNMRLCLRCTSAGSALGGVASGFPMRRIVLRVGRATRFL